jgi:transcriptional regulator with XRE-family HTH domain
MDKMNIVGPQVSHMRQELGLTQEEFSARCGVLGWRLSRGTLAKIEAQVRCVSDAEAYVLAGALKCQLDRLFPRDRDSIIAQLNQGDA